MIKMKSRYFIFLFLIIYISFLNGILGKPEQKAQKENIEDKNKVQVIDYSKTKEKNVLRKLEETNNYIKCYFSEFRNYEGGFLLNFYRQNVCLVKVDQQSIDFKKFFTVYSEMVIYFDSPVTTMEKFFYSGIDVNALFITSIDFSHFDFSLLNNTASMFEECKRLVSINLLNFKSANVINMNSMFTGCSSLKSLNLSHFDTSLVTNMDSMFQNCHSLSILDISNFNMSQIESANNIFFNTTKLDYINLYNTQDNGYISRSDINQESKIQNILYVCQQTDIITNPNSVLCCDYFNNKEECTLNMDITKLSRLINLKYNYLVNNIANQNHQIFQLNNANFQISTLKEQLNNPKEVSSVDLGDCEKLIKGREGLRETDQLIILKLDIRDPISNAINVQYEIFNPYTYRKISLDICKSIPIKINTPVIINETLIDLIDSLKDEGYDIFDLKDRFYNDICATYTANNGQDITLSGRKNRIYDSVKNVSLCQNGCEFESFDTKTSQSNCKCKVQESNTVTDLFKINFNKSEFYDGFYKTLYNSNFRTFKCIKLLFSLEGLKSNYGFYFMSSILLAFIVFILLHIIKGQNKLIDSLINIVYKIPNDKEKKEEVKEVKKIKESIDVKRTSNFIKFNKRKFKKNFSSQKPFRKVKIPIKKLKKITFYINKNNKNNNIINLETGDELKDHNLELNEIEKEDKKKKDDEIKEMIMNYNNLNCEELNDLDYEIAFLVDKRTFWQYYYDVLKKDHIIFFTFIINDDYNLRYIKILLFIVSFCLFLTIEGFFFTDESMDNIYESNGIFDFIMQLPQILYSDIVSSVISMILQKLSITEDQILDLKKEKDQVKANEEAKKIKKNLKIKLIIFLVLSSFLMLFFWYFISCFCAAYKNTQKIFFQDTLSSFTTSLITPFAFKLLTSISRILSLRAPKKDRKMLYKISKLLNFL